MAATAALDHLPAARHRRDESDAVGLLTVGPPLPWAVAASQDGNVFLHFGYGSNLDATSLRAKGVVPRSSRIARLKGYRLCFNVQHWFPHLEGGVANIVPDPQAEVLGVVHECTDGELARMDLLESRGDGYDRIEVEVELGSETILATAYVGMSGYLDASSRPTARYLNILLRGARSVGLPPAYVAALAATPRHPTPTYPRYTPPKTERVFSSSELRSSKQLTALCGRVFDMSEAPERLRCVEPLFGGKDMTLFIAHRHDSSDGTETAEDVSRGRISAPLEAYLNAYLQNYAMVFRDVGRYQ